MIGRWREDFDAGRQRVREALEGRAPRQQQRVRSAGREEPFINAVLYDGAPQHAQAAGTAAKDAEIASLRALLAELGQVAETRIAELEALLTETTHRADCLTDVLRSPGVRKMLLAFHPDRHPEADENQRRALTETAAKINAAYDLIDRITTTAS